MQFLLSTSSSYSTGVKLRGLFSFGHIRDRDGQAQRKREKRQHKCTGTGTGTMLCMDGCTVHCTLYTNEIINGCARCNTCISRLMCIVYVCSAHCACQVERRKYLIENSINSFLFECDAMQCNAMRCDARLVHQYEQCALSHLYVLFIINMCFIHKCNVM